MNVLNDLPEIPKKVKKTQLQLDEAVALGIYFIIIATLRLQPYPILSIAIISLASSIFLLYAIKCLKPAKLIFLGFLCLALVALAKLEHWWWAGYMIILALLIIVGTLIYMALVRNKGLNQRIVILGFISTVICYIYMMEHRVGWEWLLIASALLIIGGSSYRFYLKEDKNIYDFIKLSLICLSIPALALRLIHLPFSFFIELAALLCLLIFIILSFVDIFKNRIFTS